MKHRQIKFRFYDKRIKRMYYPNFIQMVKWLELCESDEYKDVLIPMQATGIYDATKFKNLPLEIQKKWLRNNKKEEWQGIEIYEGDITAIKYNKEVTDYGVVSYYLGGYQKGGTALSSYQKNTIIVGNLYEGYPEQAQYSVDTYKEDYAEV